MRVPAPNRGTILLVDDHPEVRELMTIILKAGGWVVGDSASTVSGALRSLSGGQTYSIVFTDDLLPDGEGARVADAARAKGVPVLITTATSAQHSTRAREFPILCKPFQPED